MDHTAKKLESLQMVRAFAMLMVLFIHIDAFSTRIFEHSFLSGIFIPGGDSGVNIFFVLSGFIIFYVHKGDIGKKIKFLPYLIKRFSRIYPAYWLITLILITLHFLLPQFGAGNERETKNILFSLLLLPQTHAPIIHAAWSLSHEIFFYLAFSLLVILSFKIIMPLLFFIALGSALGTVYSLQGITIFENPFLNLLFSYHNFEFILGCLSAYLVLNYKIKGEKILFALGSTLLLSMIIFERINGDMSALRLFGYGIPAFLIITALTSHELKKSLILPRIFFPKIFLLLGDASFSIYITHQLLISGIGRTLMSLGLVKMTGPFAVIIIVTILTLLIGCIFHLIIEKPLIHYSRIGLLKWYTARNKSYTKLTK